MALPFVCFFKKNGLMKIARSASKLLGKYIFEIIILSGTTTLGFFFFKRGKT